MAKIHLFVISPKSEMLTFTPTLTCPVIPCKKYDKIQNFDTKITKY